MREEIILVLILSKHWNRHFCPWVLLWDCYPNICKVFISKNIVLLFIESVKLEIFFLFYLVLRFYEQVKLNYRPREMKLGVSNWFVVKWPGIRCNLVEHRCNFISFVLACNLIVFLGKKAIAWLSEYWSRNRIHTVFNLIHFLLKCFHWGLEELWLFID